VKYINGTGIPQGVHRAERVATMVVDDFDNSSPSETGENLRVPVLAAPLGEIQGIAHVILYALRELAQILTARSDPGHRLERRFIGHVRSI